MLKCKYLKNAMRALLFARTFRCRRRRHIWSTLSGCTLSGTAVHSRTTLSAGAIRSTRLSSAHGHTLHLRQRLVEFLQSQRLDALIENQINGNSSLFDAFQIHLQRGTNYTGVFKTAFTSAEFPFPCKRNNSPAKSEIT